jgi:L-ascorbate metabolism protein UlaG (beta-lactamase superfamily)
MQLTYFGHSFWKLDTATASLVIDPFDDIGYPLPQNLTADAIIISHDHHDHNNTALISGNPLVIRTAGIHKIKEITITLIAVWHDEVQGAKRGINHLIKIQSEGKTLLHTGDLGHVPDEETLQKIGKTDFLLVPIGEKYTLSLDDVFTLLAKLSPAIVFPMHYRTNVLGFRLGELDAFLDRGGKVYRHQNQTIGLNEALASCAPIIVMPYK